MQQQLVRFVPLFLVAWGAASCAGAPPGPDARVARGEPSLAVASVALRVHRLEAMEAFYREAFGVEFHEVETAGVTSLLGDLRGTTLELVPLRDGVDREGFGAVRLGLRVPDVEAVVAAALRHGGREEGERREEDGRVHAAVRDPDGNTLELCEEDPLAEALEAIAALHDRDERASRAQDARALAELWSRDPVMLPPGGPWVRGPELLEALAAQGDVPSPVEVLDYAFDCEELVVVGDYAFEWGVVHGRIQDKESGGVADSAYKVLRVLHREGDEWRVHRAMWNGFGGPPLSPPMEGPAAPEPTPSAGR